MGAVLRNYFNSSWWFYFWVC